MVGLTTSDSSNMQIAAQQLYDSLEQGDDNSVAGAVRRMSNEMKQMAKHIK